MPIDPAKVKNRRGKLGMTQREAADKAGMPRPHWARIECGGNPDPALSTAERVASALKCKIQTLLLP